MVDVPRPTSCGSYRPGHEVHWIQASKTWNEPGLLEFARVVSAVGALVTVEVGDELRRYYNHDAARLEAIARSYGGRAVIYARWRALAIPGPTRSSVFGLEDSQVHNESGGSYLFYLATEESWKPCESH